jgi:hypothetical protein
MRIVAKKLMKEADLVVLATAVKTETSNDEPPANPCPLEFVAPAAFPP